MNERIYVEVSEDTVLFDAAEQAYMDGVADEVTGDVDAPTGHVYRVGSVIVVTNTQGLKWAYSFLYEDDAVEEFRLHDEAYGLWLNDDSEV